MFSGSFYTDIWNCPSLTEMLLKKKKKVNQVLPKQATDGVKDICGQISTNVPSTQCDAQCLSGIAMKLENENLEESY